MPIKFLLDENIEIAIFRAIVRHNARGINILNVTRVGQPDAPPRGTSDPEILQWAEQQMYTLITRDRETIPEHFLQHLASGRHSPGVFILKQTYSITDIVEVLQIVTFASKPEEWNDRLYLTE